MVLSIKVWMTVIIRMDSKRRRLGEEWVMRRKKIQEKKDKSAAN